MPLTVNGVVETWLYSKLTGNSAINAAISGHIFDSEIPQELGEVYPCVLYAFIAGGDTMYASDRAFSVLLYKIVVVGTGSFEQLDQIYTLVDALIHGGSGTINGGTGEIISCVRKQPLKFTETEQGGRKIRQSGGLYQFQARPL
jgi:hypothetical protein